MTDDARYNPAAKGLCLVLAAQLTRLAETAPWHSPALADRQEARATLRALLAQGLALLDALRPEEAGEDAP